MCSYIKFSTFSGISPEYSFISSLIFSVLLSIILTLFWKIIKYKLFLHYKGGGRMSFIELYDRIDVKIKELMDEGKDEQEARALAWEEYHKEIFEE